MSLIQPGVVAVESGAAVCQVARIVRQKSARDVFVMKEGKPIDLVRDWHVITRIVDRWRDGAKFCPYNVFRYEEIKL